VLRARLLHAAAYLHVAKADSHAPVRGINRAEATVVRCLLLLLLRRIQAILVVILMMLHRTLTLLSTSRVNLLLVVRTPTVMRHISLHRAVSASRCRYRPVSPHRCSQRLSMRGVHLVESVLLHRYFIFLLKILVRAHRHGALQDATSPLMIVCVECGVVGVPCLASLISVWFHNVRIHLHSLRCAFRVAQVVESLLTHAVDVALEGCLNVGPGLVLGFGRVDPLGTAGC
jgi:hypothetical protein